MEHYSSSPPGWLDQTAPPPSPRRRTLSQLNTTSTVAQSSRRAQPRLPPLSPSSTSSSSRFTSPPPRSPARVPLAASPATLVHPNRIQSPSSIRPQYTEGRSSVSDDKIPLGLLQTKAGKGKRVRWSETASRGSYKKSLFRRVSGMGESTAERDARQAESAQRKAVKEKQVHIPWGGNDAAGSSGESKKCWCEIPNRRVTRIRLCSILLLVLRLSTSPPLRYLPLQPTATNLLPGCWRLLPSAHSSADASRLQPDRSSLALGVASFFPPL
jgi:hypothetical protein